MNESQLEVPSRLAVLRSRPPAPADSPTRAAPYGDPGRDGPSPSPPARGPGGPLEPLPQTGHGDDSVMSRTVTGIRVTGIRVTGIRVTGIIYDEIRVTDSNMAPRTRIVAVATPPQPGRPGRAPARLDSHHGYAAGLPQERRRLAISLLLASRTNRL